MSISISSTSAHRLVPRIVAIVLAAVISLVGAVVTATSAQAATFGDVWTVATAEYDCGAHTITVWPMTNEPLDGNFSVWSYAQAYDRVSGSWVTTDWLLDDGIQGHVFNDMRSFDPSVKITYARYMNGQWVYASDWVEITSTLDSQGPFCNP